MLYFSKVLINSFVMFLEFRFIDILYIFSLIYYFEYLVIFGEVVDKLFCYYLKIEEYKLENIFVLFMV